MYIIEESLIEIERTNLALSQFGKLVELADRAHFLRLYESEDTLSPGLDSIYIEEAEKGKPSASPNTVEKKKGLISRAWDAIIKFLGNIKNAIFKKNMDNMGDPNKKVQIPKELMEVPNETSKFSAALKKKKKGIFAVAAFVGVVLAGISILKKFKLFKKVTDASDETGSIKDAKIATVPQQKEGMVTTDVGALKAMYAKMSKEFDEMQKYLLTNYKMDELANMDTDAMKMNKNDTGLGELKIQANILLNLRQQIKDAGADIDIPEAPSESAKYSITRSIISKVGNSIRSFPSFVRGLKSVDPKDATA